jgi:chondroitin AC lyase
MKNYVKCLTIFFIFLLISPLIRAQNDFEKIRLRITTELMSGPVDDAKVEGLISTLHPDGTWPGINYEDVSNTGFEHSIHYSNMVLIARAYAKQGSAWYRKTDAKNAVEKSLSFWVANDFICENWWYNQIGTPDNLVSIMLLTGSELPADLVGKAQPIIGRAHLDASGARPSGDRIKIAGILAKNLLFTGDRKKFDEVIRVIEGEIKFSTERGMQYDYSFHHRVDRVNNTLSYGLGYADAFAEWAAYVAGTAYAFSGKALNHLIDYYLDGICKSMAFGTYSDTGAKNRDITRPGGHRAHGTATAERLLKATNYRKEELEQIIRIRKGDIKPALSHSTFFWHSEHYTHQRPAWFSSVRMYSERNHNMEEPYNSEGLFNHHRGDGTNYTSRTMKEYADLAPVYDWQKIPGATIVQKPSLPSEKQIQKLGLTNFVGAVTDGQYGAVAFDFKSPHDRLESRKSWFFFDDEYVCLGAGIYAPGSQPVVTTLNQCHLNGPVTVMRSGAMMVAGERGACTGECPMDSPRRDGVSIF